MEAAPSLKQQTLTYLDVIRKEYTERESTIEDDPRQALRHIILTPVTSIYGMALNASRIPNYTLTVLQNLETVTPLLRNNWDKMPKEFKQKLGITEIEDQISKLEQLQNFDDYPDKTLWASDIIQASERITTIMDKGLENFDIDNLN